MNNWTWDFLIEGLKMIFAKRITSRVTYYFDVNIRGVVTDCMLIQAGDSSGDYMVRSIQ